MNKYEEKEIYLSRFPSAASADFYRDLFPVGSFEPETGYQESYEHTGKGNGFIVYETEDGKKHTRMVFDDLSEIEKALDYKTAFMSAISYFGRNRSAENAREMYALIFDLDEVGEEEIRLLFTAWIEGMGGRVPRPTYIVNSGGGIHLYYVFENPVPLYPNIQKQLKKLKYALTDKIWNGDTSQLKLKQFQGINQGFRLVGSKTKHGETVRAYKTGERVSLAYLSQFVGEESRITDSLYHSKLTLEEARKRFPDWYEQRIVQKRQKKNWTCKRDLYDWWKGKRHLAEVHHRYFYLMSLAVYAYKSGVSFEELQADAAEMQPLLNHVSPENPFTMDDVNSALEMYQECYRTFPRKEIEKITGIEIPANKRNGRTQAKHLQGARAIRDINNENWRAGNGRKSAKEAVFKFLDMNPDGTAAEFCELTGMCRAVFFKYKKVSPANDRKIREKFEEYLADPARLCRAMGVEPTEEEIAKQTADFRQIIDCMKILEEKKSPSLLASAASYNLNNLKKT